MQQSESLGVTRICRPRTDSGAYDFLWRSNLRNFEHTTVPGSYIYETSDLDHGLEKMTEN